MGTWIDLLADTLGQERLSDGERTRLLAAARDVAHRVERKTTPLATYLLGSAVARSVAGGADRSAAFETALASLEDALPGSGDGPASPTG
jgi:hypothetical protein